MLAQKAFAIILADERLGYVWMIEEDDKDVGYVLLTLRYAMEYGGSIAYIDDLSRSVRRISQKILNELYINKVPFPKKSSQISRLSFLAVVSFLK